MQRYRWIKASLLTMIAAGPVVWSFAAAEPAPAAVDDRNDPNLAAHLVEKITGRAVITVREDAALQLVNLNTRQANDQIEIVLRNFDNPRAQAAVAKALARTVNPNPAFIQDLQNLLGPEATMTDAAARALAQYDGQPSAIDAIKAFIDNNTNPMNVRAIAVRALGQTVQQEVAAYLINLLSAPNQNLTLINAATDTLAEMTGIPSLGNNPAQWQQWWNSTRNRSPSQFAADILQARFKLLKQQNDTLAKDAGDLLKKNFDVVSGLDKKEAGIVLRGYLTDRSPEIRIAGVERFGEDPGEMDQTVRQKLLTMIEDPDDRVRLAVAIVLQNLNDRSALQPVLSQLKVEKNLQIRVKLIQVLGKLEAAAAAPMLLSLLHDRQPEVVTSVARALSGGLGTQLRKTDPNSADQASADLRNIITGNPGPGTEDLRAACTAALAALRDKLSYDLFKQLVQPGETSEVRQAALRGLGNLADTHADETVAAQLTDNDRKVRLEAATALQTVATPSQADFMFSNLKHNPAPDDPDKDISDALWVAIQNLFPRLSPNDLNRWAEALKDAPAKRLVTLQKLGDMLAAKNDSSGVAENEQVVADAMLEVKPPRRLEAIDQLEKALKYWRNTGDRDKQEAIVGAIADDQLAEGLWQKATDFAAEQIKIDPAYTVAVMPRINTRADQLINGDPPNLPAARELIDDAQKIPNLDGKYINLLQQLQDQLKARKPD